MKKRVRADLLFKKVESAYKKGKLKEALERCEKIINSDPSNCTALIFQSDINYSIASRKYKKGDMEIALVYLNAAIKSAEACVIIEPKNPEAWAKLALYHLHDCDFAQSIICADNAIYLRKNLTQDIKNLALEEFTRRYPNEIPQINSLFTIISQSEQYRLNGNFEKCFTVLEKLQPLIKCELVDINIRSLAARYFTGLCEYTEAVSDKENKKNIQPIYHSR